MADRAITVRDLERHIAQLEQYEQATSELIRVLQSDEKCEHVMSEKTRGAITSLKMNGLRNLLISYRAFFQEVRDNTTITQTIDGKTLSKLL